MGLNKDIAALKAQALMIKGSLAVLISKLPDNPDIKRIPGNTNCFTINSSKLSKDLNLDPGYYDWKYQYRRLIEKIDPLDILTLDKSMNEIITTGKFKLYNGLNMHERPVHYNIKLHPTVIENLKLIIEDKYADHKI